MKSKLLTLTLNGLVCAGLMMGSLSASEDEGQKERVPARVRQLSVVEHLKVQEERAQRFVELKEEAAVDENKTEQDESKDEERVSNASSYYKTHEGAYHSPYSVTLLGDMVELEDGSRWLVKSTDRYLTFDWLTSDIIVITPNNSWFSRYDFCLTNISTGVMVQVNLYEPPYYNGAYTRWITAIDYMHEQISLNDGSVWDISNFDRPTFTKWLVNDTVIIGINDGLFSGLSPNILINVTTNPVTYTSCKCIY